MLFALMSKTVNSSQDINDQTRSEINTFVQKVMQSSMAAEGYSEDEMVAKAKAFYARMDAREISTYPLLQKYCDNFAALSGAMKKAKGNIAILEFVKGIVHVQPAERNSFVKEFMNELVSQANEQEKEVYDEIRYNELIIRYRGDVEPAKEQFESEQTHDETELNLISEILEWVFRTEDEEINAQCRANMFTLTRSLQTAAIQKHSEEYRAVERIHLPVTIDDYSTTVDFANAVGEEQKIVQYYDEKSSEAMAQVKDLPAYLAFGAAVASAVAAVFVSLALLIGAVIGAGAGMVILLSNKSKRRQILMDRDNSAAQTTDILRHLFEEHKAFDEEFSGYDAYAETIDSELAQL